MFSSSEVNETEEKEEKDLLSFITVNVLMTNREASHLIKLIEKHKPDFVLVTEADEWWINQLSELNDDYPYRIINPLDNTYGIAMYSQLELIDPEVKFIIKDSIPSIETRLRMENGEIISIYGVHPEPPVPSEETSSAPRDAELVIVGRRARKDSHQVIVTGDFNDVAWSITTQLFKDVSGLLDPRIGRGFFNTYDADYFFLRWPLDHLFHTDIFTLDELKVLPDINSDHFPVYARLCYEPEAEDDQRGDKTKKSDLKKAEEKVDEVEEQP